MAWRIKLVRHIKTAQHLKMAQLLTLAWRSQLLFVLPIFANRQVIVPHCLPLVATVKQAKPVAM